MKVETFFPYDDYKGYIVKNRENRNMMCLIHKKNKSRTTISYARYLMSIKENRILTKQEQVDHKDGDKTNDTIENLQILSAKENIKKSLEQRGVTRKMVKLKCPNCSTVFSRKLNATFLQKGGYYSSCSRKCGYDFLRNHYGKDELKKIGQEQIIEYYRK